MTHEFFKTAMVYVVSAVLHVFQIFPINHRKVVFFPFNGQYYCNLKYVDNEMEEERAPIQRIWISEKGRGTSYPARVSHFDREGLTWLFHFYTANVVLFNSGLPSWLYKKNGQIFIETWHGGGAYKKNDTVFKNMKNKWRLKRSKKAWNRVDYIVSSCKKFTSLFKEDTGTEALFLPVGMPRNDIFFNEELIHRTSNEVREKYCIKDDMGIVLYAPTLRDNGMTLDLDVEGMLSALQTRFHKPFILLVRSHPHVAKDIFAKMKKPDVAIDVSSYVDMQELLAASDVLITDYSSCMWDFSFTERPCFIYANDLSSYKKERNFHTPIDEWPFPLAERNEELRENILHFDERDYVLRVHRHHLDLGSYENGKASQAMCQIIEKLMNQEKLENNERGGGITA